MRALSLFGSIWREQERHRRFHSLACAFLYLQQYRHFKLGQTCREVRPVARCHLPLCDQPFDGPYTYLSKRKKKDGTVEYYRKKEDRTYYVYFFDRSPDRVCCSLDHLFKHLLELALDPPPGRNRGAGPLPATPTTSAPPPRPPQGPFRPLGDGKRYAFITSVPHDLCPSTEARADCKRQRFRTPENVTTYLTECFRNKCRLINAMPAVPRHACTRCGKPREVAMNHKREAWFVYNREKVFCTPECFAGMYTNQVSL